MKFAYSLIRYVPDPIRGEFVNVGAIAGSEESSDWAVRWVDNPARARRLDEKGSLPGVWEFIDRIARHVDAYEQAIEQPQLEAPEVDVSEEWLRGLHASHRNIVQFSEPRPLLAKDASAALDEIFAELIVDPARRRGAENNKHPALAAIRRAYRAAGLRRDEQLFERVLVHAGDHHERLDFAVANGRVVQLAQTWSFQVVDQDLLSEHVKAWGWTMQTVRAEGGVIEPASGATVEIPRDVKLAAVYAPPSDGTPRPALPVAESVFQKLHAARVDLQHTDDLAAEAATMVAGATPP